MAWYRNFADKFFPSNPNIGHIGAIEFNIWLAQVSGVPLFGLKQESKGLQRKFLIYGILLSTFTSFIYTACEIHDMILVRNNLDLFTQNAALTLTHIAGLFKAFNVFYRLTDIQEVIKGLRRVTKKYVVSDKQREAFFTDDFENKLALLIFTSLIGFTGLLGFVMLQITPNGWAGVMFPYRVKLPDFLPQKLQYFFMGFSAMILALQIVSIDYLNINMINQTRIQLNCLNFSFDELIVDIKNKSTLNAMNNRELNSRLNSIVRHHCELMQLRNDVERIFQAPLLIQFLASLVIFALTGFQATAQTMSLKGEILIYFYCGCVLFELFAYCWFGNKVFEQSKTLMYSGFNSSWYNFDERFRKTMLIYLINAGRPFIFTAGGFMELSLPSFTAILSKSYTFIAVLQQIYKK